MTHLLRPRLFRFFPLLPACVLVACEKIVDIDVNEGPTRLVIDARVEHRAGGSASPQRVWLSRTDAVFNNRQPPPAVGADVRVIDGTGFTFLFPEVAPGVYETASIPTAVGEVYRLVIEYAGDRYEAVDTVRAVPPIDSLYFEYQPSNLFQEEAGFRATIDFRDPAGIQNFYFWEQLNDGVLQLIPDVGNAFSVIQTDEILDGQLITGYQPNDESPVDPGQTVTVRQLGISRETYDYLFALFQQSANGEGSPFSVPPADVRGNVTNTTTPSAYPLGYFIVAEVAEAVAQLPADTVPPPDS